MSNAEAGKESLRSDMPEETLDSVFDHPIPTDEQVNIFFSFLKDGKRPSDLLSDKQFANTLEPETKEDYEKIIRKSESMTTVIALFHQRLVYSQASKLYSQNVPFEDRIQAGNLTLLEAIKRFERKRGNKFISYAVPYIKGGILAALNKGSLISRKGKKDDIKVEQKLIADFENRHQRKPNPDEISELLSQNTTWSTRRINSTIKIMESNVLKNPVSLEKTVYDDSDEKLSDSIHDPKANTEEDAIRKASGDEIKESLRQAVYNLDFQKQEILRLRFDEQKTRAEVAEELGYTLEKVRSLEISALRKLAKNFDLEQWKNEEPQKATLIHASLPSDRQDIGKQNIIEKEPIKLRERTPEEDTQIKVGLYYQLLIFSKTPEEELKKYFAAIFKITVPELDTLIKETQEKWREEFKNDLAVFNS